MKNMTEGSVVKNLLSYAFPLIMGNFLQLTYQAADAMIVGKGAGIDSLSAVSVSAPVSTLLIQGISGLGIGASVYMSSFYGAKDYKSLKNAFQSTLIFGTVISVLLMLLGIIFSPFILILCNVPSDIMDFSVLYLRLIFIGNIFTFQYNILSGALRALGDTKTPLRFIAVSSITNILLDIVFIFIFRLDVFGAALATVISEAISSFLCFSYIKKNIPHLPFKNMSLDIPMLKKIIASGSVTALQQSCQPVGKLLIQGIINTQGVLVIAAFNAAVKIDDYGRIPAQSISHGIMTSVSQNRGAGNYKRAEESLFKGLMIGLIYYPLVVITVLLLRFPLMSLFASGEGASEMIGIGASYLSLKIITLIYPVLTNALQGFFRGMNKMKITLISTVIQISVRTVFCFFLIPVYGINGEAIACVIGWTCMFIFESVLFFHYRKIFYRSINK